MRLIPLVLAVTVVACSPSDSDRATRDHRSSVDSSRQAVEDAAEAFFRAAPQAVGLSIATVDGGTISTFHYGALTPGGDERPTDETVYAIASITKTFTAAILARAAHEGRLDLHGDIREILGDGFPNLEYDGQPITVSQLMSHTSGLPGDFPDVPEMYPSFPAYADDISLWMDYRRDVAESYSRDDLFSDLAKVELSGPPGTAYAYSNAAVEVAAVLAERTYGEPYDVLVQSLIFEPLEMDRSSVGVTDRTRASLVTGHESTGRGLPPNPDHLEASGSIRSTILDLARFARWQLDETDPVVALSHTRTRIDLSDTPYPGYAIGLNWQMQTLPSGARRVFQNGNVPGFSSFIVAVPDLDVAVVLLANELDREIPGLMAQLVEAVLAALDPRAVRE